MFVCLFVIIIVVLAIPSPGPKMYLFLTLPIVTQAAYSIPPEAPVGNVGNVVKFSTFTMAWKRFRYISEVSGSIHKCNNRMII